MSDHADWPGLQQAIAGTGASRVFVTHGSVAVMVRWLTENGLDAQGFKTEYGDEDDQEAPSPSGGGQGMGQAALDGDAESPHPNLPPEGEGAKA
jgi:putative mRNA 3-end processing factor